MKLFTLTKSVGLFSVGQPVFCPVRDVASQTEHVTVFHRFQPEIRETVPRSWLKKVDVYATTRPHAIEVRNRRVPLDACTLVFARQEMANEVFVELMHDSDVRFWIYRSQLELIEDPRFESEPVAV